MNSNEQWIGVARGAEPHRSRILRSGRDPIDGRRERSDMDARRASRLKGKMIVEVSEVVKIQRCSRLP